MKSGDTASSLPRPLEFDDEITLTDAGLARAYEYHLEKAEENQGWTDWLLSRALRAFEEDDARSFAYTASIYDEADLHGSMARKYRQEYWRRELKNAVSGKVGPLAEIIPIHEAEAELTSGYELEDAAVLVD